jgi:hypothetical protein
LEQSKKLERCDFHLMLKMKSVRQERLLESQL